MRPDKLPKIDAWLRSALWESKLLRPGSTKATGVAEADEFEIHRLKARLTFSDGDIKIIQGVREVFEILDAPKTDNATSRSIPLPGKIVLIGRNLQGVQFEQDFLAALTP